MKSNRKLWDVIIVGGGPAGITAALRLASAPEKLDVLVVEAAVYPGAENWSGAVYFAENLADPQVLGPEELERAPHEGRIVKRGFFATNGLTMAGAEYRDPETFRHCYTVLRPVYDRYLAEVARRRGVTLLKETTVNGLIRRGDRVIGVQTDRGPIYGEIVFLAEGDAAHLVSVEGFERDAVRSKKSGQPTFLQGVKEVIQLDRKLIEERFGIGPGEACCYEVLLRNGAVDGRPVRLNMAGFIYTNRSSISVGLVLPLDNLANFGSDYNALMERYKGLPPIARLIEGGEPTSYGAKIIRSGGLRELPQLVDHGVVIGGAATGIGVDFPYPNFTGPATAMGRIFADAALALRAEGTEPRREKLEELYVEPLKQTHYYKDVEYLRDWPAFIEHSEALFARQIDLLNGSLYTMTHPQLGFARKWWETVRMVGETMKGRWARTLKDLSGGSRALHFGRCVVKHAPLALLLSIPNTVLALIPFARGRGKGELSLSFWVKGEESGPLPWYKRWVYARYRPALSKAAGVLYANDGLPLAKKLDRCVGIVMRRLSLWELLGVIVGVPGFWLTRAIQRLSDVVRYTIKRPTLDQLMATFYGRWVTGWRELTDLSPGHVAESRTHDAKLSEISYAAQTASHIKVFFPPAKPGKLEDPSKSSLWGVCPAAVYQINVDRTLHASVTVNFENCVKCETCWRIEPQHVDWSRFGKHRLIYEVYTEADGALREIISARQLQGTTEIEPSFWRATLSDAWPGDATPDAHDRMREDITAAHRAIDRAIARCDELHDDVWQGPRVLEPGQVAWYSSALEYFAVLAEEAAAATLCESVEDWLIEHELAQAHVELLQLRKDIETLTVRIREHASARQFFNGVAAARQIRDHHLQGLRAAIDRIAEACLISVEYPDPVAELRALEAETPARADAREALRERLAGVFDRASIRRLEGGGALEDGELELLGAAARAALGDGAPVAGFDAWEQLTRDDILAELSRIDPSLATIVAAHLAAADALARAGAPAKLVDPLKSARRLAATAFEAEAEPGEGSWSGRLPFVLAAAAGHFVARGGGRVALFARKNAGLRVESTPAIGLGGAGVADLVLDGAKPAWAGAWSEADEIALLGRRARDVAAIALGSSTILTERALEHARSRIQFPDMFQDMDGRDGIGKFGAVRAHLSHIEASRLAIDTLLRDARWESDDGLEAIVAKVAVTDLFGPDLPSITYRAGQVIGGSAFSEEDIFSKMYRDSCVFPHCIRENAELNVEIGRRLTASSERPLAAIAGQFDRALDAMERRPIFDFEVKRLRDVEEQLAAAMRDALAKGKGAAADEVVHDIAGGLMTRLYVWARLLMRAHRRLEGALPAERYVEAARLWADIMEERLLGLEDELAQAADRVALGEYAFELDGYPDVPIATNGLGFDYERDVINAKRGYRSGDFLVKPIELDETRYLPEQIWADDTIRSRYEEYLKLFHERFVEGDYDPSYARYVERLHYVPREDIDWTAEHGYFRVVIPNEYGGQGRSKADYYSLCQISKRLADVSHTLTIQANTSIGTMPMLFGLEEVHRAERELKEAVDKGEVVEELEAGAKRVLAMMGHPDFEKLKNAFMAFNDETGAKIGRSRVLKKVVFGKFLSGLRKAGAAGLKSDLAGFRRGLEQAIAALDGWQERVRAELDEMPNRRQAHEFYLRLISARMISAFALTEPSAGSDTARVRTEAHLDSRRVHTDDDGVKYFYLDEQKREGRRNIADMRSFEFDGRRIFYRYSDHAEPAEVLLQEYTYSEDEERYRYFMIGDRRVDIHDMALIRERDGEEYYEFFVLNGAKMWITNGHIAGVEAIYARTPNGLTGFMVDALTEGFFVGKDEEKMGQRGSPTNEITLTNVRIPRECIIGIEGRGQENALETLNVGRAGLCISASAGIEQSVTDAARYLEKRPRASAGWVRYRLGLALEEMFALEAMAYNLIGLYDDVTADALRMESATGKLFGTDGLHRNLHYLEPLYAIEGTLQRHNIEKDRRDARVMTIYEGTNEIQQFLLLGDLLNMVGPKLEELDGAEVVADGSPYAEQARALKEMLAALRERVNRTRGTYKREAFGRVLLQPIFFRLSYMIALIKAVDSALHRAHWIARNLTAEGDATRRAWCDMAARGFIAHARREFERLISGFDRDFEMLKLGSRPSELLLVETMLDELDAAAHGVETVARIERTPIDQDLEIVIALERTPQLAPRPRVAGGRLAEHVYGFSAGDRRSLRLALALKAAARDRVRVTLICAAPLAAEEALRSSLAAGADRAILLDTGDASFEEHAVAEAIAAALRERGIDFHLLLASASEDSPSGGRLGLRLSAALDTGWVPGARELWVAGGEAVVASQRFPESVIRIALPATVSVAAEEGERGWEFTTAGFSEALRAPLEAVPFPTGAARAGEELFAAAAPAAAEEGEEAGRIDPERAADVLMEIGDLGDAAGPPAAAPYDGVIRSASADVLDWNGVAFVAELEDDDLARAARAPLAAAQGLASRASLPLLGLVLGDALSDERRRTIAGRLGAYAPFRRIVFAESSALASGAGRAYAEALERLIGPQAPSRPAYLLSSPWLAEAMPLLAGSLRESNLAAEELAGVSRIELGNGDGIAFLRPAYERKLRARRRLPLATDVMRIIWCEPEVGVEGGEGGEGGDLKETAELEVVRVKLGLAYDPQTDALAEALAEARKALGVVTLENAEFVIDVGAGLGSVDNLETVVEPLRQALLEMGAPQVEIGATRKVTMDMSWLPEEHQIGQTGIRVNPRIMIALGVSGAPQHIDYVGDRAVIFAFNLDPQAPLMTLNQRREQPKVFPIVGNLLETVPRFVEALRRSAR